MKRLCELVDIGINNEACVLFKVKDNARMDMISLGCFRGDEDMIRMTKGRQPEVTVYYKDGATASYHFGEGGHTVLAGSGAAQREMIRECAILDFGIVCDWAHRPQDIDYEQMVKDTMGVRSMEDAVRNVTLASGGSMVGHIRINEQTLGRDVHVKDIPKWFQERGYEVEFAYGPLTNGLPCGKVHGYCEPIEERVTSKVLHELSDNKLVRYVQERLHCDIETADEFLLGYGHAALVNKAETYLEFFASDFSREGFCVGDLSDKELSHLGQKIELTIETGTSNDTIFKAMVKWLEKNKGKSVDLILSDANQRTSNSGGKSEVDFGKEI